MYVLRFSWHSVWEGEDVVDQFSVLGEELPWIGLVA